MRAILIYILLTFSAAVYSQNPQISRWRSSLNNPEYDSNKLKKENLIESYIDYDFSTLLTPKDEFKGYIGEDFQRIKIFYTSITKDQSEPSKYLVEGVSVVKENLCDFTGYIQCKEIREYESMHLGVDNIYKNAGFRAQGVLIGSYEFKEDPNQNHSGSFNGMVTMYWFVDKLGLIHYDDIEHFSDRYSNNQYVGSWTSYSTSKSKVCNWGEYRIPFSGDLDIGAGMFSPNPKYFNKGWEDLKIY